MYQNARIFTKKFTFICVYQIFFVILRDFCICIYQSGEKAS